MDNELEIPEGQAIFDNETKNLMLDLLSTKEIDDTKIKMLHLILLSSIILNQIEHSYGVSFTKHK